MRRLPVVFTGSAEELRRRSRRHVLVNLLLGGLSTSMVRRNTARYLESHTSIDGAALVQVPVTKSRWPAILLVLAFIVVRVATEFGHGPPLPVLVIAGVLLIPWLWGTVTARTIGAIHWRDQPLSFKVRWTEVYAASWPLGVLGPAWASFEPTVAALAQASPADIRIAAGAAIAAVVAAPLLAVQAYNFRRLRFTRTRVGDLEVAWSAHLPAYLRLWAITAAAVVATAIAPVLLLRLALFGAVTWQGGQGATALASYAVGLVFLVVLSSPARAWYEARLFVLTWNGVSVGDRLRVGCALDTRVFVRMRVAETWRTLWTLGLHHPHAVVNAYQAKLAALTVDEDPAPGRQLR